MRFDGPEFHRPNNKGLSSLHLRFVRADDSYRKRRPLFEYSQARRVRERFHTQLELKARSGFAATCDLNSFQPLEQRLTMTAAAMSSE